LQEIKEKELADEEVVVLIWLAVRKEKGIFSQRLAAKIEEVDENGVFKHEFIIPRM